MKIIGLITSNAMSSSVCFLQVVLLEWILVLLTFVLLVLLPEVLLIGFTICMGDSFNVYITSVHVQQTYKTYETLHYFLVLP